MKSCAFPALLSNHHLHNVSGLAITFAEMLEFGKEYHKNVIENAKALGQALHERGLKVLMEHKGFTESHQIVVDVKEYGSGQKLAFSLEDAHIVLNKNLLPYDSQHDRGNPSGLRIGFQDVTRRGFKEKDIESLCSLILDVVKGTRTTDEVRQDVINLRQSFKDIKYGFQSISEAIEHLRKYV